ncbi:MAG: phosphopantetheine-binding protein [Acidobacteriaceae bacterium]|jgi:acyl carrier protein
MAFDIQHWLEVLFDGVGGAALVAFLTVWYGRKQEAKELPALTPKRAKRRTFWMAVAAVFFVGCLCAGIAIHALRKHPTTAVAAPQEAPAAPNMQKLPKRAATTADEVTALIAEQLQLDRAQVKPEDDLVLDLGATPLDKAEIVDTIETVYNIQISDNDARKLKSVGDFISYMYRREPNIAQVPTSTPLHAATAPAATPKPHNKPLATPSAQPVSPATIAPTQPTSSNPPNGGPNCPNNSGFCTGTNNGTQQQFFGAPRPAPPAHFTLKSLPSGVQPNDPESQFEGMDVGSPGAELAIRTEGDFQSPTFRIVCDGGCVPTLATLYTRNGSSVSGIGIHFRTAPDPSEPKGFFIKFTVPSGSLEQGQTVVLRLRTGGLTDPVKVGSVTSVTQ